MDKEITFYEQLSDYVNQYSLRESDALRALREKTCQSVEFSHMLSPPASMQFIQLLLKLMRVKNVLEIGVYTGYSALAMAQALPDDGQLLALDHSTVWPEIGRPFWREAGVESKIELRIADARESLTKLLQQQVPPLFDCIYVDADKINYQYYLDCGYQLLASNGLMIFDDTLFLSSGSVVSPNSPSTRALDAFNKKIHLDERFDLSLMNLYQGLTLVRKR